MSRKRGRNEWDLGNASDDDGPVPFPPDDADYLPAAVDPGGVASGVKIKFQGNEVAETEYQPAFWGGEALASNPGTLVPTAIAPAPAYAAGGSASSSQMIGTDDLKRFFTLSSLANIEVIDVEFSQSDDLVREAISAFKKDISKQKMIIPLVRDAHFAAIIIDKSADRVTYFDPMVRREDYSPYHPLDDGLAMVLLTEFPTSFPLMSKVAIQPYVTHGQGDSSFDEVVNNHCGHFAWFFACLIANDFLEIRVDGSIKFSLDGKDYQINPCCELDAGKSNLLGNKISELCNTKLTTSSPALGDEIYDVLRELLNESLGILDAAGIVEEIGILSAAAIAAPEPALAPDVSSGGGQGGPGFESSNPVIASQSSPEVAALAPDPSPQMASLSQAQQIISSDAARAI